MNKALNEFIKERDKRNGELWEAIYEIRKPMNDLMKKWIEAREDMNRPVREYLDQQWRKELNE